MRWNKGFTASCYATYVDPDTWGDLERFEILSGNITLNDSELKATASLETDKYVGNEERWIRIWLDAQQNSDIEHIPLFTGLATSPTLNIDGNTMTHDIECYSVLKPAEDILLPRGWYVMAGSDGVKAIERLLEVTNARFDVGGDATILRSTIVAENNENRLSMAIKILDAIGWIMRVLGDGTVQLMPEPSTIVATFEPTAYDVVEPSLTVTSDWFDCPNVYRAVMDEVVATARDESATSPLSVQNRGREVWVEEENAGLSENESLAQYARRKLKEAQKTEKVVSYTRRFDPDIKVGDIIQMKYDQIQGLFRIREQQFSLGLGLSVSEEGVQNG